MRLSAPLGASVEDGCFTPHRYGVGREATSKALAVIALALGLVGVMTLTSSITVLVIWR